MMTRVTSAGAMCRSASSSSGSRVGVTPQCLAVAGSLNPVSISVMSAPVRAT